jgi:hypothetical protein
MKAKPNSERERITIALRPEMRERIDHVAAIMGFGTSEAVRYLMARGLEGVTAIIATADSAKTLRSMFEMAERQEVFETQKTRSGPSNTRPKVQKSSSASKTGSLDSNYPDPPEAPPEASLFDILPTKKKEKK